MESSDQQRDTRKLALSATRGVFWTGGGQVILQIMQVGTSVTLARLLAPEHFGLIGMAMIFIGFAQILADFGLGTAIVQAQKPDPLALSSAFWANTAVGLVLMIGIAGLSPLLAAIYGHPEIQEIIAALSISLFFAALNAVPGAILYKAMNFAALAKVRVFGTAFAAATAIGMAASGFGVWSLVVQPVVGSFTMLVVTWLFAGWLPQLRFSFASIRAMVGFSAAIFANAILYYLGRSSDSFLIGKYLGSGPLGYYAMAYQLMLYPINQVSSVIIRVLFPTLVQLQNDPASFRHAYLKSVSVIAFVTFPIMLGLFAATHDFIIVVFGDKWLPMENLVRILALVGMGQSVSTGVGTILLSTGRTGTSFVLSVIGFVLFFAAFVIGLRWGVEGVATAFAIIFFAYTASYTAYVLRLIGLRPVEFPLAFARSFIAAAVMFAAVTALVGGLGDSGLSPVLRLSISVATGIAVYGAMSFAVNRAEILSMYRLVSSALRHR